MQRSALDLRFEADSFDCGILSLALHEHPRDEQRRMVEEALRVLRPGGIIILADYAYRKGFRPALNSS